MIGIIPARYDSTRFPGKSLALISGKPLIQWVYEQAVRARRLDSLLVATDDDRIFEAVQRFGGQAVMTAATHQSGTDRIAEVMQQRTESIVVNIQGDEPLIDPRAIDAAIEPLFHQADVQMSTLVTPFSDRSEWENPNVVKAVCDDQGFVLYFSRAPIPFPRQPNAPIYAKKHIGLYVYRRDFLLQFSARPAHVLEQIESLEQLRALAMGARILAIETAETSLGVDVPADVSRVEAKLKEKLDANA